MKFLAVEAGHVGKHRDIIPGLTLGRKDHHVLKRHRCQLLLARQRASLFRQVHRAGYTDLMQIPIQKKIAAILGCIKQRSVDDLHFNNSWSRAGPNRFDTNGLPGEGAQGGSHSIFNLLGGGAGVP